jgi:hypothetical protein
VGAGLIVEGSGSSFKMKFVGFPMRISDADLSASGRRWNSKKSYPTYDQQWNACPMRLDSRDCQQQNRLLHRSQGQVSEK